jgi:4-aminobutyrate aminotransferase/(S)-3-amino-2-methylpropionate transaminase
LACCIAKTNIELIINDKLPQNAASQGSILLQETQKLFQQYMPYQTGEIRGLGLMIAIELVTDKESKTPDKKLMQKFLVAALRQGLMVCCSWDFQTLILMPPLNITAAEIKEGLNRIETILQVICH